MDVVWVTIALVIVGVVLFLLLSTGVFFYSKQREKAMSSGQEWEEDGRWPTVPQFFNLNPATPNHTPAARVNPRRSSSLSDMQSKSCLSDFLK